MGLIRNAAIIAVAITLIPADPQDRANLYAKAQNGVIWAATFCDRNEKTCVRGRELRDAFFEKASFAAAAAYDIALTQLTEQDGQARPALLPVSEPQPRPTTYRRGTLTAYDRDIAWRGH